jgi:hypothetical protein
MADVPTAQAALDVVDVRLGHRTSDSSQAMARFLAGIISLAMLVTGQLWLLAIPAFLALIRPSTSAFAGVGALALASAAVGVARHDWMWSSTTDLWGLLVLAVVGAAALVMAIRRRGADEGKGVPPALIALGAIAALLSYGLLWMGTRGAVDETVAEPVVLLLAVTLLGLGVGLLRRSRRATRWAGAAAAVVALVVGAFALNRESRERSTPITWTDARAEASDSVQLAGTAARLRLSPRASHYAALDRSTERPLSRRKAAVTVGRFDGTRREIEAIDVVFADEERLLALSPVRQGLEVRLERADEARAPLWRDTLALDVAQTFSVDAARGTWTVIGYDDEFEELHVFLGTVDRAGHGAVRWPSDSVRGVGMIAFEDGTLIVPTVEPLVVSAIPLMYFGIQPLRWTLWRVASDGRRRVGTIPGYPTCGPSQADSVAFCIVRDRDRTSLWSITARGAVTLLAMLPAGYGPVSFGAGHRIAAMPRTGALLIIDAAARRGIRTSLATAHGYPSDIQPAAGSIGTLHADSTSVWIMLYRTEGRVSKR